MISLNHIERKFVYGGVTSYGNAPFSSQVMSSEPKYCSCQDKRWLILQYLLDCGAGALSGSLLGYSISRTANVKNNQVKILIITMGLIFGAVGKVGADLVKSMWN